MRADPTSFRALRADMHLSKCKAVSKNKEVAHSKANKTFESSSEGWTCLPGHSTHVIIVTVWLFMLHYGFSVDGLKVSLPHHTCA